MTTAHRRSNFILTPEQQTRLQKQRELVAAERPQLQAKLERIHEAKQEPSLCGQLRRAIHQSGRLITELAAEAGITTRQLGDFLSGDRTLRSDVLDRLTAAVGGTLAFAEKK
ncbi:MAG: helix-turn-helix transcriptional regulator [Planctomycetales bacterium]|nr:helix-turn-helix transcriptional regulator [Planctomycetales bacterium]